MIKIVFWQPIDVYKAIDFEKPVRGMKVGMMPAKLAHIMVNIARAHLPDAKNFTVYDPFVGFGTIGMVVNWLGGSFIGSDINITMAKQNFKRWQSQPWAKDDKITLFKHDVFKPFSKGFLKNVDAVVSEGWLGPVIKSGLDLQRLAQIAKKVSDTYEAFLKNWRNFVA